MTQSLAQFQTNLAATLLADADLDAWFVAQTVDQGFGAAPIVIKGNVPFARIPANKWPALVFEIGAGSNELEVPNHSQNPKVELPFSLIWKNQDPAGAYDQRTALIDMMITAVLRNPTLDTGGGDAVGGCWIKDFDTDRGAHHPVQVLQFTAEAFYQIEV